MYPKQVSRILRQKRKEAFSRSAKQFGRAALPWVKRFSPSLGSGLAVFVFLLLSGLGDKMGETLAPLTGAIPAAFIVFGICFIPVLSTLIGPGMIIILAAGFFTAEQIAAGSITPFMAVPFLLALDARIGGGFISPGLFFGEDQKETLNAGIPALVFTRLILLPAAVVISCIISFWI